MPDKGAFIRSGVWVQMIEVDVIKLDFMEQKYLTRFLLRPILPHHCSGRVWYYSSQTKPSKIGTQLFCLGFNNEKEKRGRQVVYGQ